jgi:hypothetical protein
MNEFTLTEREARLYSMGGFFIAVNQEVNLEDVCSLRGNGGIVRVHGDHRPQDCISVFVTDAPPVGCVAGWVSEED